MPYKVAVLMGGKSHERDFSLSSGKNVCAALERAGHEVLPLDVTDELVNVLRAGRPQVAYNALHGRIGDDGTIQALMGVLGIPLVGCPTSVCRQTWNKSTLHAVLEDYYAGQQGAACGINGVCLSQDAFKDAGAACALDLIVDAIPGGFPLVVKPAKAGSAMGMSKVETVTELAEALLKAFTFSNEVLVQEFVEGVQLAVSVLGEAENSYALPPVEIVPKPGKLYDTEARINDELVDFYAPVRLESLSPDESQAQAIRSEIERAAVEVYQAYGCRDLARVDIIWDGARAKILEIDVSPGMGPLSGFPMACRAAGLSLEAVLSELLDQALYRG